jgi:hypothetical protein
MQNMGLLILLLALPALLFLPNPWGVIAALACMVIYRVIDYRWP